VNKLPTLGSLDMGYILEKFFKPVVLINRLTIIPFYSKIW
jgi:hypothetical protein